MRVLVTNDDGVTSPGIRVLAEAARHADCEVVVAAPSWDSSGASASLTGVERDGRLLIDDHRFEGLDDVEAYGVSAAPAMIVRAAVHGAFGDPPDLVLSGVNNGANTGHAVLHSGTVGAVLTGATFGRRGAAFSICTSADPVWENAAGIAPEIIGWLLDADGPVVLNVNVPDVGPGGVRGLVSTRLATFGAVQTSVTEIGQGYVRLEYTDLDAELEPGTDVAVLADGYASVTPLLAVCEAGDVDLGKLAMTAV